MILTAMTKAAYERPGMTEQRSLAVPAGRLGRPEDIAEVALFLVSDLSGYVNAEDIAVDGGFTRNLMGLMPRTAQ
jgi:NAD(P)-dependent dehydrogenase (short-subunit alcohol dehydrogenase family)